MLADVVSVDGKTLRTLAKLVTRPGFLTYEYVAGRRVRWTQPAQLYLLVVALFFVVNAYRPFISIDPGAGKVLSSLSAVAVGQTIDPAEMARRMGPGVSPDAYRERFEAAASGYLSTFLLGTVVLFALLLKAVHRKRPLGVHLVFALHWTAFYLLLMIGDRLLPEKNIGRGPYGRVIMAAGLVYLCVALRRAYGGGWVVSALQALGLKLAFYPILIAWMASAMAVAFAFA